MRVRTDPSPKAKPSRIRGVLLTCLKAGVSIVLLWLLFSRVDFARLWSIARTASVGWLALALVLYLAMILTSAWRWGLLLKAQRIGLPFRRLASSFLVATFFNNFLPSNIGGDVIRVADTAPEAGSKTLAATVVLVDRAIGLLGLVLMAAIGATAGPRLIQSGPGLGAGMLWVAFAGATLVATLALLLPGALPRLLQPLRVLHPAWVDERLARLGGALERFSRAPASLAACFVGALIVQALLVGFYLAIATSMDIPIGFAALAVVVPLSFIVQMLPVSMNGFGVREATFGFYFTRLGLSLESALLVSFMGAALVMMFSLSGGVVYLVRRRHDLSRAPAPSALPAVARDITIL
ncbi:MAG TPA: lysylphosphatidylglycerol synthase transmembrane domain-containing protein [Vicinamibacterales bacterium]|nr:lysylphosphatidylglycerol synthase transmembrane domain-containing protein [Vicinamibacterales bacterium]